MLSQHRGYYLLFLIPFLTVFSAGVFLKFIDYKNISLYIFFIPIFIYLMFTQYGLGAYKYVYFNEFVDANEISVDCNNVDGCGNWPTDYWGYSGKEVAEFLNENLLAGEIPKKSTFAWKNNFLGNRWCCDFKNHLNYAYSLFTSNYWFKANWRFVVTLYCL